MVSLSRSNNFDSLRLLLAVLVFFSHWSILTSRNIEYFLFHLSGFAVDSFFIVSGFLIFWSFDNDQNKKHFYIKRFFRIFPLYGVLIFSQTLFFILYSDGSILELLKYFVSNIVFLNFLAPSVGHILSNLQVNAINGSLWTLKNEVIFYLCVPLIFQLCKRWRKSFLILIYTVSVIYMFMINAVGSEKLMVQFPAQLRLFTTGIMLYVFFSYFDKNKTIFLAFIGLIAIILMGENLYFKLIIYPILLGFIVLFLTFYLKPIKINFDFSYSFYILHFPVIQLALYFNLNPKNPIASFIILLLIVLVLSYFSEKYIEKRFVRMGKEIVRKNKNDVH